MRKLIVCNIISLDGFYSGPGGDVMDMPFDDGSSDYNAERLRAADTLLLGRKSFEALPVLLARDRRDVSRPAVKREISRLNTAIEKVVVSNSLKPDEVEGWGQPRVVRRVSAHAEVATLKKGLGRENPGIWRSRPLERPSRRRLGRRAAFHDRRWRCR